MHIGLVIPIADRPDDTPAPRFAMIRALAEQSEQIGCDAIWLFDHLLYRFPEQPERGIWEIWTVLSALATATERVQLGTLVMCTAFRNPALLAKMAATLDEVSAGRLILGLGAGWHQPEFDAFGIPFGRRVDRFHEALQIIVPLLRAGRVDFRGTHYQAPDCALIPRGPRPQGPPILIGAFGPRMLRLTAQYADAWNTCWLGHVDALAERRTALEAACRDVGRDPADLAVTVGINIVQARPGVELPPADKAIAGDAPTVAAGLRAYADAGVAHAVCLLDNPTPDSFAWFGEVLQAYRTL